jgi:hypothetical protein
MTGEVNHVEAYWQPRMETAHECAGRLSRMLDGLAKAHPAFAHWSKKANTRAAANKPAWAMPPDTEELTAVFEKGRQYKDVPRIPWPEMGYRVSAWNGLDPPYGVSLSVRPGGYGDFPVFPNTIDLSLGRAGPGNTDLISVAVLKPALLSVATAWEPDYAVVVSWNYWPRKFGDGKYPSLRSGWLTYLAPRYADLIKPPSAAIVEPVPGGGMLLLATEERFSMDNPKHLAVADAIQAALEPLQTMVPPGRDDHLRRERSR